MKTNHSIFIHFTVFGDCTYSPTGNHIFFVNKPSNWRNKVMPVFTYDLGEHTDVSKKKTARKSSSEKASESVQTMW